MGVTGGIATGKSTVTRLLAGRGAATCSADEDARAVLEPGSATLADVFAAFPSVRAGDGTLDRSRLAAEIFADTDARKQLETLTHPAIIARMQAAINAVRAAGGLLVYETPLLYEAGLGGLFDVVVAVVAAGNTQAERLQEREARAGRPPLTDAAIAARLAAQLPAEEKARRADYVIHTDGTLAETVAQVGRFWAWLGERQASGE